MLLTQPTHTQHTLLFQVHDPLEVLETSQRCLKAFARAGDFEALRKVLEQMRALHVEPASWHDHYLSFMFFVSHYTLRILNPQP